MLISAKRSANFSTTTKRKNVEGITRLMKSINFARSKRFEFTVRDPDGRFVRFPKAGGEPGRGGKEVIY